MRLSLAGALLLWMSSTQAFAQAPPTATEPASAEIGDRQARDHFEAGRLAFAEGRYQSALDHFQSAYNLSARSHMLYNIGQCADRLRQNRIARDAFERFLATNPSHPRRAEVQARLAIIEGELERQEQASPSDERPAEDSRPAANGVGSPAEASEGDATLTEARVADATEANAATAASDTSASANAHPRIPAPDEVELPEDVPVSSRVDEDSSNTGVIVGVSIGVALAAAAAVVLAIVLSGTDDPVEGNFVGTHSTLEFER